MYMRDWVRKLDDFLRVNDREVCRASARLASSSNDQQTTLVTCGKGLKLAT
jgi:hypothetical protein